MLLVNMFAKLILLSVKETSDLHATFAMADHPPAERTCCPNPANTNGNGGPAHTQSKCYAGSLGIHVRLFDVSVCFGANPKVKVKEALHGMTTFRVPLQLSGCLGTQPESVFARKPYTEYTLFGLAPIRPL